MATGKMRIVENLRERMLEKQAGLDTLSRRAGVDRRTVYLCRLGKPVRVFTAECIEQALEQFSFKYRHKGLQATALRYAI
jgi:hypothetical protein